MMPANAELRSSQLASKTKWWRRTALWLTQHEHPYWIFFERFCSPFRLDLVIDPVAYPLSLSFLCFTLGALF